MKVLMTADAVGGVWTYALELSAALAGRDVRVVLATMGPQPRKAQRREAAAIPQLQLVCSDYRLEWMEAPWDDVHAAGDWLMRIAAREAVDLVHLNGYAHAALAWNRPVLSVAHSCVCSWWQAVHGCAPPTAWDAYRSAVRLGLHGANAVVAPTEAFARELRRWYGDDLSIQIIPNARMLDGCDHARARLPIILACGRVWDEAKNFGALNQAAAGLPWHTYVAGNSTSPDGRSRQVPALRFLGSLRACDVAGWMRRAAIFVHPARYEPFGLSVLEAATAGCALVLADLPSLRELWDGAALFVDPAQATQLGQALRTLIDDAGRRRELSLAAELRARRYRPDRMAAEYLGLYRELLVRTPGEPRTSVGESAIA